MGPATVHALSLTLIAAVYIGFKDLWQHRRQFVAAAILVVLIAVGVDFQH